MLISINFKKYCLFEFWRSWKASIQSGFPPSPSGIVRTSAIPEHHKMVVSDFSFGSGKATRVQEMVGKMDP